MELTVIEGVVFVFCLIGCGLTSYKLGQDDGMHKLLDYLVDTGQVVLEVEKED